jgi:hypothetical protein
VHNVFTVTVLHINIQQFFFDGAEYGGSSYISRAVSAVFDVLPEYDSDFLELFS